MSLEEELKGLQDSSATEEVYRDPAKLLETQTRMSEIERDLAEANDQ